MLEGVSFSTCKTVGKRVLLPQEKGHGRNWQVITGSLGQGANDRRATCNNPGDALPVLGQNAFEVGLSWKPVKKGLGRVLLARAECTP